MTADEAFFCCTPFCILPALRFQGRSIGNGKRGPVYSKLVERWGEKVGVDIIGQIEKWGREEKSSTADGATPYKFDPPKP
jgi:branched-chain amino acid aminotransferase